jgi:hypothetical protein
LAANLLVLSGNHNQRAAVGLSVITLTAMVIIEVALLALALAGAGVAHARKPSTGLEYWRRCWCACVPCSVAGDNGQEMEVKDAVPTRTPRSRRE